MKIRAAVMSEPAQAFKLLNLELQDQLLPHEVLVRIVATGLCHTDLAVRDQHLPSPFPVVLGHEGAGVVEAVGMDVKKVSPGDQVVLAPSSCGKCAQCISGHPSYCQDILTLNMPSTRADGTPYYTDKHGHPVNGGFFGQSSMGTCCLTSERNVIKVNGDVPLEMLGPLGCGLQTGAGTVLNVLRPVAGESIAIFGAGPVGLAAVMAAKASGCTIIVAVDVNEQRLELARSLGATHVINSKTAQASTNIRANVLSGGVHYAIDSTGRNDVINQAIGSLQPRGRCALVAIPSVPKLEIDYAVMIGRSVEFVLEGDSIPDIFIPQLISLYQAGLFPFDKLITFYSLDEINKAVSDFESGSTLKAIIRMT
jgi:aryl-alcohol dehydrogenase